MPQSNSVTSKASIANPNKIILGQKEICFVSVEFFFQSNVFLFNRMFFYKKRKYLLGENSLKYKICVCLRPARVLQTTTWGIRIFFKSFKMNMKNEG